jgi:putative copper resistance protein D
LIDPLAAVRAIHFAAAILIAGAATFSVLVGEPVWQRSAEAVQPIGAHRGSVVYLLWAGLAATLASAITWLALVAAEITGGSWIDAIRDGTAYAVLTDTQFGFVFQLRLLLVALLAALLLALARRGDGTRASLRIIAATMGAALLGSLAWTGHAGGASGSDANVHLLADILHLLVAGAWVGGLLPLAILLARLGRIADRQSVATCAEVLRRFSNVGVVAVAVLFASGMVNTWFLTGHMRGLIGTAYGQLVQFKIALFLLMLCLAADNRLRLLPRIAQAENERSAGALRQLRRNTMLEIALGLIVIYVVGVLGLTPPAGHMHGAETSPCEARWPLLHRVREMNMTDLVGKGRHQTACATRPGRSIYARSVVCKGDIA